MAKWRQFNETIFQFRKNFRKQARVLTTVWIKRTVRCDEGVMNVNVKFYIMDIKNISGIV